MDKVLLAIDGFNPNQGLFSYAVDLCRRMKAELSILQVIRPGGEARGLKKLGEKAQRAGAFFENAMMAATFAEANEHETAVGILKRAQENLEPFLSEPAGKGVRVNATTRLGAPEHEIPDYVNNHRDVVITVCDCHAGTWKNGDVPQGTNDTSPIAPPVAPLVNRIRRMLPVPLVVWRQ